MGTLDDRITALRSQYAHDPDGFRHAVQQVKATAINDIVQPLLPLTVNAGVWHVVITQVQAGMTKAGFGASIWLTATKSGVAVPLELPLVFVNHPLLVDDPAGPIARTSQSPRYAGGAVVTRRLREDPLAALRATLVSTLTALA